VQGDKGKEFSIIEPDFQDSSMVFSVWMKEEQFSKIWLDFNIHFV
jgi:hypothetical protein